MPSKKFCPNCSLLPRIDINNNLIDIGIQCKCGYNKTLSVEEYFNIIKTIKAKKINEIEKGKEYIYFYFSFLKTNAIKASKENEAQIESSYKKCYQKNMNFLSLLNIIKVGYRYLRFQINIYQYNDNIKDADKVIQYFDTYNIVSFEKKTKKIIKGLSAQCLTICRSVINILDLLKDGRPIVGTDDGDIYIVSRSNFKIQIKKKAHRDMVTGISQLYNNDLVTASSDRTIKIWKIHNKQLILLLIIPVIFELSVASMVEISNERMAVCGEEAPISFWDIKRPYKNKLIKKKKCSCWYVCFFYIKEKELLFSGGSSLSLWDTKNLEIITNFDVNVFWTKSICKIDKSRIIVGGSNTISIINFDKLIIEFHTIIRESDLSTLILRKDGNVICLRADKRSNIAAFNINDKTFQFITSYCCFSAHNYMIPFGKGGFITLISSSGELALWHTSTKPKINKINIE